MDKDLRKVIKALDEQGFTIDESANGMRLRITRDENFIVVISVKSKDWRGLRNGIAALRRAGFRWPPRH